MIADRLQVAEDSTYRPTTVQLKESDNLAKGAAEGIVGGAEGAAILLTRAEARLLKRLAELGATVTGGRKRPTANRPPHPQR